MYVGVLYTYSSHFLPLVANAYGHAPVFIAKNSLNNIYGCQALVLGLSFSLMRSETVLCELISPAGFSQYSVPRREKRFLCINIVLVAGAA